MKKRTNKSDFFRYKLTEIDLDRMAFRGIISEDQRDLLILTSKLRVPNTPAQQRFQMGLNGRGSIMLNSIVQNGGEDAGTPYHFVAEITHKLKWTTFKRFMRYNKIPINSYEK